MSFLTLSIMAFLKHRVSRWSGACLGLTPRTCLTSAELCVLPHLTFYVGLGMELRSSASMASTCPAEPSPQPRAIRRCTCNPLAVQGNLFTGKDHCAIRGSVLDSCLPRAGADGAWRRTVAGVAALADSTGSRALV